MSDKPKPLDGVSPPSFLVAEEASKHNSVKGSRSSLASYWSSIPGGLKLLLWIEVLVLAGTTGFAGLVSLTGRPIPNGVTLVELLVLAFTIIVLTLLTEYTTRRSSKDVRLLVDTVQSENRTLIAENRAHWAEQRNHIDGLVKAIVRLTELQSDLIAAVKKLDESERAAVEAQKADMKAREDALRQEIEKHKPALDVRIMRWEGKIIKHFVVFVSNHGPPGVDLDVTFTAGDLGASEHSRIVSQGNPCERDFGDINQYPDSGEIVIMCEVSNGTRSHRYRFIARYEYHRNKGFWGSSPTLFRKSPEVLVGEVLY